MRGFASFLCLTGSKWTAFGFWSVCWTKEDILRCHFGRFYIFIGVKIISGWIYNENKPSFSRSSCCLIGPTINNRCKIPLSVSQNRRAESSCESGSFTPTFSMNTRVKILCRGGRRERLLRGSAAASTDQTAALPQDIVFEQRAGAAIIHAFTPTAEWSHFQAAGVPMYAYLWVKSTSSRPLSGGCWKAFWEKLGLSDWSGSRRESGYTELMTEALHITDGWYNSVRVSEGGCSFKMSAEYPALWGLFSGGVHLTGSVVDDLKLTPLCSMMGDFGSPRCAHSPDVVEEVDRLQLLHPSWLFYESAVINMIGGVQAFSVPRRNELETGDVRRQTPWLHPRMLESLRCWRHHRGRGYKWLSVFSAHNSLQEQTTLCLYWFVQWLVFLVLLRCHWCWTETSLGAGAIQHLILSLKIPSALQSDVMWSEVRCAPFVNLLKWRVLTC